MSSGYPFIDHVIIGFILGLVVSCLVGTGAAYLDYAMNWNNKLDWLRYRIALVYSKGSFSSLRWLIRGRKALKAASYGKQFEFMIQSYENVAKNNKAFGRWICRFCMAGYFGLIIALITFIPISIFSSWFIGFSYLVTLIIMPYRFAK